MTNSWEDRQVVCRGLVIQIKGAGYDTDYRYEDFVKEIHIVPDNDLDCFDHDLDFHGCFCKPRLVNKATITEGIERAIYMHNIFTEYKA